MVCVVIGTTVAPWYLSMRFINIEARRSLPNLGASASAEVRKFLKDDEDNVSSIYDLTLHSDSENGHATITIMLLQQVTS